MCVEGAVSALRKMRIGTIQAETGTKRFSYLKVGEISTSDVKLPVMIINGSKDGTTLALTAGIHGCEYSGIEAVIRIFNTIDPRKLRGRIIAVPVVNTLAFQARTPYVCPIDGVNLNRIFPGDAEGSISHKIAHAVFYNVVSQADFVIDLHGADLPEELPPSGLVIVGSVGNKKVDSESQALADLFDAEYILMSKIEGSCTSEACKIGIPAIGPEAGGLGGRIEEKAVSFYTSGILNVMKYLKMIEGAPEKKRQKKKIVNLQMVRTRMGGIFYPKLKAGSEISKGKTIGSVKSLKGSVLERITASIDGIVFLRMTYTTVNTGDIVMILGELES